MDQCVRSREGCLSWPSPGTEHLGALNPACYHHTNNSLFFMEWAERHDFWSRFLLLHSPFLFPLFLGGKRKGEWNSSKNRNQKAYLSVPSHFSTYEIFYNVLNLIIICTFHHLCSNFIEIFRITSLITTIESIRFKLGLYYRKK